MLQPPPLPPELPLDRPRVPNSDDEVVAGAAGAAVIGVGGVAVGGVAVGGVTVVAVGITVVTVGAGGVAVGAGGVVPVPAVAPAPEAWFAEGVIPVEPTT